MFRSSKDLSFEKQLKVPNDAESGFRCDICGQGPWNLQLDVDIHRKTAHKWDLLRALKNENVPMCSICLRAQINKQALIQHILVNHLCSSPNATILNREIYICDHCDHLFFNKQLLIAHIFHWHTKKTPENSSVAYNCPKCWKTVRAKSMWFHLLYHGALNVETCPICLKTCDNHAQMLEHIKTHPYMFRCNICNYETTRECYFNNHLAKHKTYNGDGLKNDVARFFLPQQLLPSLNNRMNNTYKGIPLANEVRICILCRALCFSELEMEQHIYGAHEPEKKEKSKTHQCYCGEVFFNSVLLKHHIFKLKGNHGVWDGVSPIPDTDQVEDAVVFQVYALSDPIDIGLNEIIIRGISSYNQSEDNDDSNDNQHIRELREMEN